uniref:Uncharacterized protein n=1 Tax=Setaria italica TaxID=4555 RepID=K3YP59_SETIT
MQLSCNIPLNDVAVLVNYFLKLMLLAFYVNFCYI